MSACASNSLPKGDYSNLLIAAAFSDGSFFIKCFDFLANNHFIIDFSKS